MSEHQPHAPQETPEAQLAAATGVSKTRRRLLRAGAIGAPALIALKPAAVMATDCKMPSGFTVSGNLSRGNKGCATPGRRPSQWLTSIGDTVYKNNKGKKASAIGLTCTTSYSNDTLENWLKKGDSNEQALIVACYLEALSYGNDSNWPKKERFQAMWNLGVIGNSYMPPNQTTPWDRAKVIAYLKFLTGQIPV
jgi:hypothetical protein